MAVTADGIDLRRSLALALYDTGAVRFGDFRLKLHERYPEAPLSPIYIDLRLLRRFPAAKRLAVDLYAALAEPLAFELLADTPTAATPLVSSLADRLEMGMISPRLDGKGYGTGARVDGLLPEDRGRTALLIDDVITQADSKLQAASVLEAAGMVVRDIAVLIDRQGGGRERLEAASYRLHAALTLDDLLQMYADEGRLEPQRQREVREQLESLNRYLGEACIER